MNYSILAYVFIGIVQCLIPILAYDFIPYSGPRRAAPGPDNNITSYDTLLDLCVSSLRRGHANLLCIVPILTDDPRRESNNITSYDMV